MGWNDHIFDIKGNIVECSFCGKKYLQEKYEQTPGFRDKEDDICPYCGKVNGTSMEYEFSNSKISNEEDN